MSERIMVGGMTIAEYHESKAVEDVRTYRVVKVGRGTQTHASFREAVACGADKASRRRAHGDYRGEASCLNCKREVERRRAADELSAYEVEAARTASTVQAAADFLADHFGGEWTPAGVEPAGVSLVKTDPVRFLGFEGFAALVSNTAAKIDRLRPLQEAADAAGYNTPEYLAYLDAYAREVRKRAEIVGRIYGIARRSRNNEHALIQSLAGDVLAAEVFRAEEWQERADNMRERMAELDREAARERELAAHAARHDESDRSSYAFEAAAERAELDRLAAENPTLVYVGTPAAASWIPSQREAVVELDDNIGNAVEHVGELLVIRSTARSVSRPGWVEVELASPLEPDVTRYVVEWYGEARVMIYRPRSS